MANQNHKFAGLITQNLPDLDPTVQQWWIEHPKELGHFLADLGTKHKLNKCWSEDKDGIITITVTSDGTTAEQWLFRLRQKGMKADKRILTRLQSGSFTPTTDVKYEVKIVRGESFGPHQQDAGRLNRIITKAVSLDCEQGNLEVALLLRDLLSDENIWSEMNIQSVIIAESLAESENGELNWPQCWPDHPGNLLRTYEQDDPMWTRNSGFAFVLRKRN